MTVCLFVDPFLLCPPEPLALDRYIANITALGRALAMPCFKVLFSENSIQVLADSEAFPALPAIKLALRRAGRADVQPQDVSRVITGILSRAGSAEVEAGARDFICDDFKMTPYSHVGQRAENFRKEHDRLLGLMHIKNCLNGEAPQLFVTSGLPRDPLPVAISGTIDLIEYSQTTKIISCPHLITSTQTQCEGEAAMIGRLDLPALFCEGLLFITALELYIRCRINAGSTSTVRPWRIGREFEDALRRPGFLSRPDLARKVLDTCADTVLRDRMSDCRHLRVDAGPSSSQQYRGQDGAWRRDIDDEYRLHYWETTTGPEFALVGPHRELRIPH